jgi:hypothetical protein
MPLQHSVVKSGRKISTFVGQTVGYGIGIARVSVGRSSKSISEQYRISNTVKSGPGGI